MTEIQDDDRLDLGDDHILIFSSYQDENRVGAHIKHNTPDGTPCDGWVTFAGRSWANCFPVGDIPVWTVEQEDPLTLSPSVLCRGCGDHGFVRAGRWVRA